MRIMLCTAIVRFEIVGALITAAVRVFGARNSSACLALPHGLLAGVVLSLFSLAAFATGVPPLAVCALSML